MKIRDIARQLGSSLEARILVTHITGLSDVDLIGQDEVELSAEHQSKLDDMVDQRLKGRPISKIIGRKEFYGRNFITSDDVLDPRPDTETVIDAVLDYAQQKSGLRILDMGTGSGCLVLTLLAELSQATAVATDISKEALAIAQENAIALHLADRVEFMESDWFESVRGQFDIIVSNPPYIETADIENLDADVKIYDPRQALDGGVDGLFPYKVILPQIRHYLKKGGFLALEHGTGQCGRIKQIAEGYSLSPSRIVYDLGGHDRVFAYIHK